MMVTPTYGYGSVYGSPFNWSDYADIDNDVVALVVCCVNIEDAQWVLLLVDDQLGWAAIDRAGTSWVPA